MTKVIQPGAMIGIIGAGQLGKMLAQSAQKMGYKVAMYDPNPTSCGFAVAHSTTVADFTDREALLKFVQSVDVVTYEFENIDGDLLKELESESYLPQGTNLLLNSQDRIKEKNWLNQQGIPTTDFAEVNSWTDLTEAIKTINIPAIIKTTRFGYDGKGQVFLTDKSDLEAKQSDIEALLKEQTLILEAFCDFKYEVSVIVSQDLYGNIEIFPISQNQHINGVLYSSIVGANYSEDLTDQIYDIAEKIAKAGKLIGVCGIEFFITEDEEVFVNEIAPRPHNTGHYTIEATNVSQFDQHILGITGRSLINIRLFEPGLMINILGQHLPYVEKVSQQYPEAIYHIYDKGEAKKQRKMGHFTLTKPDYNQLETMLYQSTSLKAWQDLF
ncbi:5-(carboxyamino)imidazole ribonucleotide synthase [Ruoffia tabacinasalis]|uniref:N5-carboxyaminoimidazole ribonucleotide synthase n=1 Tax=Ruoffia tabacinasalis TaxID=87458 RepID=A0A5R9EG08_9LACT|nr:5-(carboxyamino)imidazole ribonucleotide synthase [Ruoffia tabacinasalis]TLQ49445.1 5-(carboxyamino)imidazole ribonucleotide synthase [Ruoffia tabacinasalis]